MATRTKIKDGKAVDLQWATERLNQATLSKYRLRYEATGSYDDPESFGLEAEGRAALAIGEVIEHIAESREYRNGLDETTINNLVSGVVAAHLGKLSRGKITSGSIRKSLVDELSSHESGTYYIPLRGLGLKEFMEMPVAAVTLIQPVQALIDLAASASYNSSGVKTDVECALRNCNVVAKIPCSVSLAQRRIDWEGKLQDALDVLWFYSYNLASVSRPLVVGLPGQFTTDKLVTCSLTASKKFGAAPPSLSGAPPVKLISSTIIQSLNDNYSFAAVSDLFVQTGLPKSLRLALRRAVRWIADGHRSSSASMQLVSFVTAIESILTGDDDNELIKEKLALRTAWILGRTKPQRLTLYDDMRSAYDARSKAVHGSSDFVLKAEVRKARRLATDLVRRLAPQLDKFPTVDGLIGATTAAILGAKSEFR